MEMLIQSVFFQETLIKTKQRNRIETKLMNAQLTLKYNYMGNCLDFEPTVGMLKKPRNAVHQDRLKTLTWIVITKNLTIISSTLDFWELYMYHVICMVLQFF